MKPESDKNTRPTVFGLSKKREQVITLLGDAFVANDLDIAEYERRLEIAQKAGSVEALENAIYDFPQYRTIFPKQQPIQSPPYREQVPSKSEKAGQPIYSESPAKHMVGAFEGVDFMTLIGNTSITSIDIVNPMVKTITVVGDSVVDLRGIAEKFPKVKLECYGLVGNLKIKVPQNTAISNRMIVILGEKKKRVKGQSVFTRWMGMGKNDPEIEQVMMPDTSVLEVELVGFTLIGDVTVEYIPVHKTF